MKKRGLKSLLLGVACLALLLAATSAAAQEKFVWRMQVVHNPTQLSYKMAEDVIKELDIATNGRLKIELFPGGAMASSLEGFQACGDGVFDVHANWPVYLRGVDPAFDLLSATNMSASPVDHLVWMLEAGGNELAQKMYDQLNLQHVTFWLWPQEVMSSRLPFTTIKEMGEKGNKFRTSAPVIAGRLGMQPLVLPLEEILTGLVTGAVDSAEMGYFDYNYGIGLWDVAKYGIWPDFWNVKNIESIVVNKDSWAKLPPDLQMAFTHAFASRQMKHFTKAEWDSAVRCNEMHDAGTHEFWRMATAKKEFAEMRKLMFEIEKEQLAAKTATPLLKAGLASIYEFYEAYYPFRVMSAPWGEGMTADEMAGFPLKRKYPDR